MRAFKNVINAYVFMDISVIRFVGLFDIHHLYVFLGIDGRSSIREIHINM